MLVPSLPLGTPCSHAGSVPCLERPASQRAVTESERGTSKANRQVGLEGRRASECREEQRMLGLELGT